MSEIRSRQRALVRSRVVTRRTLAIAVVALLFAALAVAPGHGSADTRRYTVEEGARLSPAMERTIASIAEEFHRRTGRGIHVTSGTRTPREQARAMYDKLRLGQQLTRLYRDYEAASEIQRAYRQHRREGASACVQAMARVIRSQVRRGCYISRHLRAQAADVRSRDMSRRERRVFEQVVGELSDVSMLREGTPPHFHLQLR